MKVNALALLIIVWAAFTLGAGIAACGGPTQFETVQTFEADNKILNATATAAAVIAAGGDPDADIQVAAGSIAAQAQATAAAKATAGAAEGGGGGAGGSAVGSASGSESEQEEGEEAEEIEVPEGPALEGETTIMMIDTDKFDPEIVKVKVGTIVTWENPRNSATSARNFEGEAEQWDTGDLYKSPFNRELCCGSHTFTIVGCHRYRSEFSGDTATGAVCVVE